MNEQAQLLRDAAQEIRALRQRIELLAAQVKVIEIFGACTMGAPQPLPMVEDTAWRLDREAAKLEAPAPVKG